MSNKLKNKIIIVTGGNGLLGSAIVEHIRQEGAFCINFEINHKTNDDLSNVECDITNKDSIDNALSLVLKKYKRITWEKNNAKTVETKPVKIDNNIDLYIPGIFIDM